jgi:hypothetical protein
MWMRKLQSSNQTTWEKPTTSAPHLARQRSTRTLQNTLAANLAIQVILAVAAETESYLLKNSVVSFLFFSLSLF